MSLYSSFVPPESIPGENFAFCFTPAHLSGHLVEGFTYELTKWGILCVLAWHAVETCMGPINICSNINRTNFIQFCS